jgi:hypothetical protein
LIHTRQWPDLKTLTSPTADWVDNYFNTVRRHSYLGYLTPREYELGYRVTQLAAQTGVQKIGNTSATENAVQANITSAAYTL